MSFAPQRIEEEWTVDAPASLVWDVLGHTDRLNRDAGLPSVQISSFDDEDIGRPVRARLYGLLPLAWTEYPFEWVRGSTYSVQRDYTRGPLVRFRGGVEILPAGSGCTVRMFAELTPRNLLGKLAIPLVGRDTLQKAKAYCAKAIAQLQAPQVGPPTTPGSVPTGRADRTALQPCARRLGVVASLDQGIVGRLLRHLDEGGDDEVLRMQPYALAARWRTDPHETLRVFLHATRAGLLSLRWQLLCPNCRVPTGEAETLSRVERQFHCDTCGIDYDANLDRFMELRFRVHPTIRSAQDLVFCFGGPYLAPHILIQHLLRPGDRRELSVTLDDEAYRIRTLRRNDSLLLLPGRPAGDGPRLAAYRETGWEADDRSFSPGPFSLAWRNETDQIIGVVLERLRWDDRAVTAAKVAALQEFRDLFGSEVLAPGLEIGVDSVTILFSDLKESTRLYEEAGDAPAYGHVRRHFDFLKERIARHQGAVVKTIGDAVMAVFHRPADGVGCGLAIQRDLPSFNASLPDRPPLVIKLGLHHGPAIAINANGLLDYFGRTVNVASRLLRESVGGDLVLAKDDLEDVLVREMLAESRATIVAEWTCALRGIAQPLPLCRIRAAG
ncbi:MAG: adenylate/guanylate cyclase domain-containing protein [Nitrospirota bacterium]|nr:adenylate/guanylate cyclase domain-containing protein [Nitrospirota bacterium]